MQCPKCQGRKYTVELNITKATKEKRVCADCGGTGLVGSEQQTGVRVARPCCDVLLYQYLEKGQILSTLEIWAFPMLLNGNPVMMTRDGVEIPAVVGEVHMMRTVEEHRRRGLMKKLLKTVLSDPSYRVLRTSWTDSTKEGRQVCASVGLVRKGDWLVWEPVNGKVR
jgi:hypothetical protein